MQASGSVTEGRSAEESAQPPTLQTAYDVLTDLEVFAQVGVKGRLKFTLLALCHMLTSMIVAPKKRVRVFCFVLLCGRCENMYVTVMRPAHA